MPYNGTVELAAGIKPKNNGSFPLVNAPDVRITDSKRLDAKLTEMDAAISSAATAAADGADAQTMIAAEESSNTAAAAHAVGDYFRLSGTLYIATDTIAVGDTITVGTNCRVAVLGNDVSDLKSAFSYVSYRKNLIGNEANVYYPIIPLKSGEALTISTSNGESADQTYVFSFYSRSKTLLGQSQFKSTDGSYKVYDTALTWGAIIGTAYIAIDKQGTVPFQAEFGRAATTYEPYFPNGLMMPEEIARVDTRIDLADAKTNANYNDLLWMTYSKNIVGNDDSVYYPIIPLKPTDYLTFSTQSGNAPESTLVFDFYDASKALMGQASFGPSHGASRTIHIGTTFPKLLGACYVRPEQMSPDQVQIELGQTATTFGEYVPNSKHVSEIISNERMDNVTWMVIGDSLTDPTTLGAGVKIYANYVADKTGLTVINKGVGGTGYWRGTDVNKAFYQRIASFTDPTPNIITFFGSFNDLGTDSRDIHGADILGTASDTTADTIGGCINLTLDAAITYAPDALLGIIAPTEWQGYYYDTNSRAYVQLLEDIAKYRGIPFLNLYTSSNLRPNKLAFRNTYYLNADGTHPNTLGHKRFAGLVEQFIKGIYCA